LFARQQPIEVYEPSGGPNQCLITRTGGDIYIGTADASKKVRFEKQSGDFALSFKTVGDVIIDDSSGTNADDAGVMERMYNLHYTLESGGDFQSTTPGSSWTDLLTAHETTLATALDNGGSAENGGLVKCNAELDSLQSRIDDLEQIVETLHNPLPANENCDEGVKYSTGTPIGTFSCV